MATSSSSSGIRGLNRCCEFIVIGIGIGGAGNDVMGGGGGHIRDAGNFGEVIRDRVDDGGGVKICVVWVQVMLVLVLPFNSLDNHQ